MFARINRYRRKRGTREDATARLAEMEQEIMALPGMVQVLNVMHKDGTGYLITVIESEAQSAGHAAKAAAIWARFAPFLESLPEGEGYDVTNFWTRPGT